MLGKIVLKFCIVIAVFFLFKVTYKVLGNRYIYDHTLAQFSTNYERSGTAKRYIIYKVSDPYIAISENNAYNWDAAYYLTIRNKLYGDIDPHFSDRYAFFPFFPMVWKLSGINTHHIIWLNYMFFGLAMIILTQLLTKDKPYDILFFTLALLIPSAIIFYLPYAESLFVLTMVIAIWGLYRGNYWIYFIGMLCFGMTRPAVMVVMFAFIGADVVYFFRHRNIKHFVRQSALTIAPVLLGCLLVIVIQYFYSDSWTAYFDTDDLWHKESGFLNRIRDWSVEGYGMNSFSIFFLAFPALISSIVWAVSSLLKKQKSETVSLFGGEQTYIKEYLFHVSVLFIAGILLYLALTSGNTLNGFFRYTMAVPFFYIVLFMLPEKLEKVALKYKIAAFSVATIGLFSFLINVRYSGDIWRFEYFGMYLWILMLPLFLFYKEIPLKYQKIMLCLYILPAIVWHTYLFNMYLSNAWIFT